MRFCLPKIAVKEWFISMSAHMSLRQLFPGNDDRAHPDQAPLTETSQSSRVGRGAPRFPMPEVVRDALTVAALFVLLFAVLCLPEIGQTIRELRS